MTGGKSAAAKYHKPAAQTWHSAPQDTWWLYWYTNDRHCIYWLWAASEQISQTSASFADYSVQQQIIEISYKDLYILGRNKQPMQSQANWTRMKILSTLRISHKISENCLGHLLKHTTWIEYVPVSWGSDAIRSAISRTSTEPSLPTITATKT